MKDSLFFLYVRLRFAFRQLDHLGINHFHGAFPEYQLHELVASLVGDVLG